MRFQRISLHIRPKRIERYAFSNDSALVWTGPEIIGFSLDSDKAHLPFTDIQPNKML